jgi:glycosyltransferase involved in cell wall biosynthesis
VTVRIPNIYWPFDGDRDHWPGWKLLWHALDMLNPVSFVVALREIRTFRPDVVVTENLAGWSVSVWLAARLSRVPVMVSLRDYALICIPGSLYASQNCAQLCSGCRVKTLVSRLAWKPAAVVANSRAVLDLYADFGLAARDESLRRVAYPLAVPGEKPRRADRQPRADVPVVGYLGRLEESKGVSDLVDAAHGLGLRLLIAGDGPRAVVAALERRAAGEAVFLGTVDSRSFFEQIDVLVVPSRWREPFGRVVVEAGMAGVPVLIADHPGLKEAAERAGLQPLTFPGGDVGSLRRMLKTLAGVDSLWGSQVRQDSDPAPPAAEVYEELLREVARRKKGLCS